MPSFDRAWASIDRAVSIIDRLRAQLEKAERVLFREVRRLRGLQHNGGPSSSSESDDDSMFGLSDTPPAIHTDSTSVSSSEDEELVHPQYFPSQQLFPTAETVCGTVL
jgi:hypothetical protein